MGLPTALRSLIMATHELIEELRVGNGLLEELVLHVAEVSRLHGAALFVLQGSKSIIALLFRGEGLIHLCCIIRECRLLCVHRF